MHSSIPLYGFYEKLTTYCFIFNFSDYFNNRFFSILFSFAHFSRINPQFFRFKYDS